jgi:hypothetical protein
MSNTDILNHIKNSQLLLEEDLKTLTSSSDNEPQINQRLTQIMLERRIALASMEKEYYDAIHLMNSQIQNDKKNNMILDVHTKKIKENSKNLTELRNKISLLKRQIEIDENEFLKRSYIIFILKQIFIFSLLSVLIALLLKNGNIDITQAFIAECIIALILAFIFLYNEWRMRYRNANSFNKMDWPIKKTNDGE